MRSLHLIFLCLPLIWAIPLEPNHPVVPVNKFSGVKNVGRIVGGDIAFDGDYPYQAAVYFDTSEGSFFCGGALINEGFVITAGHCVITATIFTLHFGAVTLVDDDDNRLVDTATHYQYHPDFDPTASPPAHDLGLIRLTTPVVEFNAFIQPIALPTSEVATGASVTVTGWGATGDWGGPENHLSWVTFKTITNAACEAEYPGTVMGDGIVCAQGLGNEGVCDGDNGGPLVTKTNGDATLVGIVLFASSVGCQTNHPSGFTRVYPNVDWITDVTSK